MEAVLQGAEKKFTEQLAMFQISLSPEQLRQFRQFYENLIKWNEVMNLTAITDEEDVYTKHFLDSLSIVGLVGPGSFDKLTMVDVGTGAGFPGAVLAIADPEKEFILLDSTLKRLRVIDEFAEKLGISNIRTVHARAEEISKKADYNCSFDICVSRAVAGLDKLAGWCLPFVRQGGYFIAYKGENYKDELDTAQKSLKKFRGKLERAVSTDSLSEDISGHVLLVIRRY